MMQGEQDLFFGKFLRLEPEFLINKTKLRRKTIQPVIYLVVVKLDTAFEVCLIGMKPLRRK